LLPPTSPQVKSAMATLAGEVKKSEKVVDDDCGAFFPGGEEIFPRCNELISCEEFGEGADVSL
jgi:hypothetical protein